ncbi:MAG: RnfABCDGE type electron transport complex subunit D, partial [Planctomycetes bacterium]|nr:RnfABCDGE type electron transport complex subunit D [Planctomycetota bacterium]
MSDAASPAEATQPKIPDQFLVSSAPHLAARRTTRSVMFDVVLGLIPLLVAAILFYHGRAAWLTIATVLGCLAAEGA